MYWHHSLTCIALKIGCGFFFESAFLIRYGYERTGTRAGILSGWCYVNTHGDLSACGQRVSDLAPAPLTRGPPEVGPGSVRCGLMAASVAAMNAPNASPLSMVPKMWESHCLSAV